eukprot:gene32200-39762_t
MYVTMDYSPISEDVKSIAMDNADQAYHFEPRRQDIWSQSERSVVTSSLLVDQFTSKVDDETSHVSISESPHMEERVGEER